MRTTAPLFLTLALTLLGCEKSESNIESTTPADTPSTESKSTATAALPTTTATAPTPEASPEPETSAGRVQVTVTNPGAEPRRPLRFKLDPDKRSSLEMRMEMRMDMDVGGVTSSGGDLPQLIATMALTPANVSAEQATYNWRINSYAVEPSPEIPQEVRDTIAQQLKPLVGTTGTHTTDNRGRNLETSFELPSNVTPEMAQMVGSMEEALSTLCPPLPAEAVGVGATWRTTVTTRNEDIETTLTYTFTLTNLQGNTLYLDVDMASEGTPGPFNPPGMPPGAIGTLVASTGKGHGKVVLNLDDIVPHDSSMSSTNDTEITIEALGQQQTLKTAMTINVVVKRL